MVSSLLYLQDAMADSTQIADEVDSSALTLRFKHGRHTILLFAEPLTTISELRDELLTTLRERYPKGLPLDSPSVAKLPSAVREIRLGIPKDQYDPSKGWTELETDEILAGTPKSLGLKDGCMVAFVFEKALEDGETVFNVSFAALDELDGEDE